MKRVDWVNPEVEAAFAKGLVIGAGVILLLACFVTTPDQFIKDGRKFKIFKKKFKCKEER